MPSSSRNTIKRLLLSSHKLAAKAGLYACPNHYYSAGPDVNQLKQNTHRWAIASDLPGITVDLEKQTENLKTTCLPYIEEYRNNETYHSATQDAMGPGYGPVEAQALHGVVRTYKPKNIIEVGSGVSTRCMLHAIECNTQENPNNSTNLTSVEPYPSTGLKKLPGIQLITKPVQDVPFEGVFSKLGKNDLLFIDSSHTVKPDSDVNYLFLEILPRLAPGVIIHIHDIYLPYDYTPNVLNTFFHWMETSLLRAYLIHNHKIEILFCLSHLHDAKLESIQSVFPGYKPAAYQNGLYNDNRKPFEHPKDAHLPASIYLQTC